MFPASFRVTKIVGTQTSYVLTSGSTGIPVPDSANGAWIQAKSADAYIRMDGAPASASDFQIRAGDPPVYLPVPGGSFFNASGASSTLIVQGVFVQ